MQVNRHLVDMDRPSTFAAVSRLDTRFFQWPPDHNRTKYLIHSMYFGDAVMDTSECVADKEVWICERCPQSDKCIGIVPIKEGTLYLIIPFGAAWPIDLDRATAHRCPGFIDGERVVTEWELSQLVKAGELEEVAA